MNGDNPRRTVTVPFPEGLHLRVAAEFAKRAGRFNCDVKVWKGTEAANGKSSLELLMLGATQGTELVLETSGPDAAAALDALSEFLSSPLDEANDPAPPPKG
ncbi:MAG: HPr family phosphocarrier protein [Gemmataceae bacterium]|nr:HPr family phosphocarrier protein [Gemmataceae bacterium]MDW8266238.1 HPr family phosphocarrier protein [Gemmataceae bacterium]